MRQSVHDREAGPWGRSGAPLGGLDTCSARAAALVARAHRMCIACAPRAHRTCTACALHAHCTRTACTRHSYNAPQLHCTLYSSNGGLHFGREVTSPLGGHQHAAGARGRLCSDVIGRGGRRQGDEHSPAENLQKRELSQKALS